MASARPARSCSANQTKTDLIVIDSDEDEEVIFVEEDGGKTLAQSQSLINPGFLEPKTIEPEVRSLFDNVVKIQAENDVVPVEKTFSASPESPTDDLEEEQIDFPNYNVQILGSSDSNIKITGTKSLNPSELEEMADNFDEAVENAALMKPPSPKPLIKLAPLSKLVNPSSAAFLMVNDNVNKITVNEPATRPFIFGKMRAARAAAAEKPTGQRRRSTEPGDQPRPKQPKKPVKPRTVCRSPVKKSGKVAANQPAATADSEPGSNEASPTKQDLSVLAEKKNILQKFIPGGGDNPNWTWEETLRKTINFIMELRKSDCDLDIAEEALLQSNIRLTMDFERLLRKVNKLCPEENEKVKPPPRKSRCTARNENKSNDKENDNTPESLSEKSEPLGEQRPTEVRNAVQPSFYTNNDECRKLQHLLGQVKDSAKTHLLNFDSKIPFGEFLPPNLLDWNRQKSKTDLLDELMFLENAIEKSSPATDKMRQVSHQQCIFKYESDLDIFNKEFDLEVAAPSLKDESFIKPSVNSDLDSTELKEETKDEPTAETENHNIFLDKSEDNEVLENPSSDQIEPVKEAAKRKTKKRQAWNKGIKKRNGTSTHSRVAEVEVADSSSVVNNDNPVVLSNVENDNNTVVKAERKVPEKRAECKADKSNSRKSNSEVPACTAVTAVVKKRTPRRQSSQVVSYFENDDEVSTDEPSDHDSFQYTFDEPATNSEEVQTTQPVENTKQLRSRKTRAVVPQPKPLRLKPKAPILSDCDNDADEESTDVQTQNDDYSEQSESDAALKKKKNVKDSTKTTGSRSEAVSRKCKTQPPARVQKKPYRRSKRTVASRDTVESTEESEVETRTATAPTVQEKPTSKPPAIPKIKLSNLLVSVEKINSLIKMAGNNVSDDKDLVSKPSEESQDKPDEALEEVNSSKNSKKQAKKRKFTGEARTTRSFVKKCSEVMDVVDEEVIEFLAKPKTNKSGSESESDNSLVISESVSLGDGAEETPQVVTADESKTCSVKNPESKKSPRKKIKKLNWGKSKKRKINKSNSTKAKKVPDEPTDKTARADEEEGTEAEQPATLSPAKPDSDAPDSRPNGASESSSIQIISSCFSIDPSLFENIDDNPFEAMPANNQTSEINEQKTSDTPNSSSFSNPVEIQLTPAPAESLDLRDSPLSPDDNSDVSCPKRTEDSPADSPLDFSIKSGSDVKPSDSFSQPLNLSSKPPQSQVIDFSVKNKSDSTASDFLKSSNSDDGIIINLSRSSSDNSLVNVVPCDIPRTPFAPVKQIFTDPKSIPVINDTSKNVTETSLSTRADDTAPSALTSASSKDSIINQITDILVDLSETSSNDNFNLPSPKSNLSSDSPLLNRQLDITPDLTQLSGVDQVLNRHSSSLEHLPRMSSPLAALPSVTSSEKSGVESVSGQPLGVTPVLEQQVPVISPAVEQPIVVGSNLVQPLKAMPVLGQPQGIAPTLGPPLEATPVVGLPHGITPTLGQPHGIAPTVGQTLEATPVLGQPHGIPPTLGQSLEPTLAIGQPQGITPTLGQPLIPTPILGQKLNTSPVVSQPSGMTPVLGQSPVLSHASGLASILNQPSEVIPDLNQQQEWAPVMNQQSGGLPADPGPHSSLNSALSQQPPHSSLDCSTVIGTGFSSLGALGQEPSYSPSNQLGFGGDYSKMSLPVNQAPQNDYNLSPDISQNQALNIIKNIAGNVLSPEQIDNLRVAVQTIQQVQNNIKSLQLQAIPSMPNLQELIQSVVPLPAANQPQMIAGQSFGYNQFQNANRLSTENLYQQSMVNSLQQYNINSPQYLQNSFQQNSPRDPRFSNRVDLTSCQPNINDPRLMRRLSIQSQESNSSDGERQMVPYGSSPNPALVNIRDPRLARKLTGSGMTSPDSPFRGNALQINQLISEVIKSNNFEHFLMNQKSNQMMLNQNLDEEEVDLNLNRSDFEEDWEEEEEDDGEKERQNLLRKSIDKLIVSNLQEDSAAPAEGHRKKRSSVSSNDSIEEENDFTRNRVLKSPPMVRKSRGDEAEPVKCQRDSTARKPTRRTAANEKASSDEELTEENTEKTKTKRKISFNDYKGRKSEKERAAQKPVQRSKGRYYDDEDYSPVKPVKRDSGKGAKVRKRVIESDDESLDDRDPSSPVSTNREDDFNSDCSGDKNYDEEKAELSDETTGHLKRVSDIRHRKLDASSKKMNSSKRDPTIRRTKFLDELPDCDPPSKTIVSPTFHDRESVGKKYWDRSHGSSKSEKHRDNSPKSTSRVVRKTITTERIVTKRVSGDPSTLSKKMKSVPDNNKKVVVQERITLKVNERSGLDGKRGINFKCDSLKQGELLQVVGKKLIRVRKRQTDSDEELERERSKLHKGLQIKFKKKTDSSSTIDDNPYKNVLGEEAVDSSERKSSCYQSSLDVPTCKPRDRSTASHNPPANVNSRFKRSPDEFNDNKNSRNNLKSQYQDLPRSNSFDSSEDHKNSPVGVMKPPLFDQVRRLSRSDSEGSPKNRSSPASDCKLSRWDIVSKAGPAEALKNYNPVTGRMKGDPRCEEAKRPDPVSCFPASVGETSACTGSPSTALVVPPCTDTSDKTSDSSQTVQSTSVQYPVGSSRISDVDFREDFLAQNKCLEVAKKPGMEVARMTNVAEAESGSLEAAWKGSPDSNQSEAIFTRRSDFRVEQRSEVGNKRDVDMRRLSDCTDVATRSEMKVARRETTTTTTFAKREVRRHLFKRRQETTVRSEWTETEVSRNLETATRSILQMMQRGEINVRGTQANCREDDPPRLCNEGPPRSRDWRDGPSNYDNPRYHQREREPPAWDSDRRYDQQYRNNSPPNFRNSPNYHEQHNRFDRQNYRDRYGRHDPPTYRDSPQDCTDPSHRDRFHDNRDSFHNSRDQSYHVPRIVDRRGEENWTLPPMNSRNRTSLLDTPPYPFNRNPSNMY